MVNIGDREFGLDPGDAHGLKFQICHGTGGILSQGLVDPQGNFAANGHITGYQMIFDNFLCNCHSHD